MDIYFTTHNSGPSWTHETTSIDYVGTDVREAIKTVGTFQKYRRDDLYEGAINKNLYSVLPCSVERELVAFYAADGWWYSVVKVAFEATS